MAERKLHPALVVKGQPALGRRSRHCVEVRRAHSVEPPHEDSVSLYADATLDRTESVVVGGQRAIFAHARPVRRRRDRREARYSRADPGRVVPRAHVQIDRARLTLYPVPVDIERPVGHSEGVEWGMQAGLAARDCLGSVKFATDPSRTTRRRTGCSSST